MSTISKSEVRNRLLRSLSPQDFALLSPYLKTMALPMNAIIEEPDQEISFVVFPESGICLSGVVGTDDGFAEASQIGREGMTGRSVVLGSNKAMGRIVIKVPGDGLMIGSHHLSCALDTSKTLRNLMNSFVLAGDAQTSHAILAAANFSVGQRLARALLMYHDRIDGDDFPVTHALLSRMLNVRRPGITEAMHILEGEHAIKSRRGHVTVLSRRLLMGAAGSCYGIPEREYERLIPSLNGLASSHDQQKTVAS